MQYLDAKILRRAILRWGELQEVGGGQCSDGLTPLRAEVGVVALAFGVAAVDVGAAIGAERLRLPERRGIQVDQGKGFRGEIAPDEGGGRAQLQLKQLS
jgi:hypothetical protein